MKEGKKSYNHGLDKSEQYLPPPNNEVLQKNMPNKQERYSLQGNVKESMRQGGNLNKGVINNDLDAKDAYCSIKDKYGNHSSKYNILTGH